jgi:hypothetical protein
MLSCAAPMQWQQENAVMDLELNKKQDKVVLKAGLW